MSRQFNYELDENQIKSLMLNSELEFNESLWEKFEHITNTKRNTHLNFSKYFQKIDLNINKTIVLFLAFVALISGFSSMLFTLVDFKKTSNNGNNDPLMADYREIEKKHEPIYEETENTKKGVKSVIKANVSIIKDSVNLKDESQKLDSVISMPDITPNVQPIEEKVVKDDITKETISKPSKKRRKTNMKSEELPIIKTVTNLNEGLIEPELDL